MSSRTVTNEIASAHSIELSRPILNDCFAIPSMLSSESYLKKCSDSFGYHSPAEFRVKRFIIWMEWYELFFMVKFRSKHIPTIKLSEVCHHTRKIGLQKTTLRVFTLCNGLSYKLEIMSTFSCLLHHHLNNSLKYIIPKFLSFFLNKPQFHIALPCVK